MPRALWAAVTSFDHARWAAASQGQVETPHPEPDPPELNPSDAVSRILCVVRRRRGVDDVSDEALLSGVALGDEAMAVAFVRRFQSRAYGLALSMVGEPSLAEDIAQEAFLRVWRHAAIFDARRGSVVTWLLSITRNLAIDSLRLRRSTPMDPEELLGFAVSPATEGPDDTVVRGDDASRLRVALGGLPPEQRRAIVLASFFGRTAQEIGESEGIPLGTAKSRIRAGMLKLRDVLTEEETSP
jgi:RNA polymerase sigma-70 factor (ECF subfamily)